ncbi:MAG TPA: S9 family peptidase, partial [Chryseolinea sp.]|nr:S9 family peptidase [Chryseolinea sp.]
MNKILIALSLATFALGAFAQSPLNPSDVYRVKYVDDPEISPDGKWVLYVLSEADTAEDKYDEDIWMTATDGSGSIQLTYSGEDETQPKWSPDNKWISFLSGRDKAKEKTQFWI